jgi:hypothetical protein
MILKLSSMNSGYAANIAAYSLLGGTGATVFYRVVGLGCPMQSIGLACPGCGCGRAATALISEGPIAAIQQQPTALLLLVSIVLLAVVGRSVRVSKERWLSSFVILLPFPLAFANLVFQLNRAGVT